MIDRVVDAFREEGADAWFDSAPERFLGDGYDAAEYEQVIDIVDVWFDSGSTHAFCLKAMTICHGLRICISKVLTSIAAGSILAS